MGINESYDNKKWVESEYFLLYERAVLINEVILVSVCYLVILHITYSRVVQDSKSTLICIR